MSPVGALNQPHVWYKYGHLTVRAIPPRAVGVGGEKVENVVGSAAWVMGDTPSQLPRCFSSASTQRGNIRHPAARRSLLSKYSKLDDVTKKSDYSMLMYVVLPDVSLVYVERDSQLKHRLKS